MREIRPWKLAKTTTSVWHWKKYILLSYILPSDILWEVNHDLVSRVSEMKFKNGFTSNISRYLWRNLFHFSKLRWLVGFPFYSIYSIFKLISKKKLNLHIYLLIEFQLESKFEIIFSPAAIWLINNESYLYVGSIRRFSGSILRFLDEIIEIPEFHNNQKSYQSCLNSRIPIF